MAIINSSMKFDIATYLADIGPGRKIIELGPNETFFCQGDTAEAVFYLQKGRAELTVVSPSGKEATIGLVTEGEFIGKSR